MRKTALFALVALAMLSATASAVPFTVDVRVNGVDPSKDVAVLKAGEAADVSIVVKATAPDVTIDGVEFTSSPSAMAGIVEAFMEKRTSFPYKLEEIDDANAYELPGFLPGGDYNVVAKVRYSGSYKGTTEYNARVRVENEGILSLILGLLLKVIPKAVAKPVFSLVI